MKIRGTTVIDIEVSKSEIISMMIDEAIGKGNTVVENESGFFLLEELDFGGHISYVEKEIHESMYFYIKSLEYVLDYLSNNK